MSKTLCTHIALYDACPYPRFYSSPQAHHSPNKEVTLSTFSPCADYSAIKDGTTTHARDLASQQFERTPTLYGRPTTSTQWPALARAFHAQNGAQRVRSNDTIATRVS